MIIYYVSLPKCEIMQMFIIIHNDRQTVSSHMVMDYLLSIVLLCVTCELAKVIDQWSHAGRKVNYTVHQLS